MFSFMLRVCVTVVNMKREQCSAFNHSAIIVIIYIDFRTSVACSCLTVLLHFFLACFLFFSDCLSTFPPVLLSCIAVAMREFL